MVTFVKYEYVLECYESIPSKSHSEKTIAVIGKVVKLARKQNFEEAEKKLLEGRVRNVCNDIRRKLNDRGIGRNYQRFRERNYTWLQTKIMLAGFVKKKLPGRPPKNFAEAHSRSQRRKIDHLRKQATGKELALAAEMNLRADGHNDAAKVINAVVQKSENNGSDVRAKLRKGESSEPFPNYTANEALALKLQLGLGKNKYKLLRMGMVARGLPDMYPSHEKVEKAEHECLPSDISVTEHGAEVRLQALVDHTAARLLVPLEKAIEDFVRYLTSIFYTVVDNYMFFTLYIMP